MPSQASTVTNPCKLADCQNGANCIDLGNSAVCQCLPGFGGNRCEKLLSVNFVDRDTYLQFTDLQNWPRANITLQVGVKNEILYQTQHELSANYRSQPICLTVLRCNITVCKHITPKTGKVCVTKTAKFTS